MQTGLNNLLRFMSGAGIKRLDQVLEASRDDYFDFYLQFRRAVRKALETGNVTVLQSLIDGLKDERQIPSYVHCATKLDKWLKKNDVRLVAAVTPIDWISGELSVAINPEFRLRVNGNDHTVKLYMAKDKLTRSARRGYTYLVESTHGTDATPAILDLRHTGGLLVATSDKKVATWVRAEAAAYVAMAKMNHVA